MRSSACTSSWLGILPTSDKRCRVPSMSRRFQREVVFNGSSGKVSVAEGGSQLCDYGLMAVSSSRCPQGGARGARGARSGGGRSRDRQDNCRGECGGKNGSSARVNCSKKGGTSMCRGAEFKPGLRAPAGAALAWVRPGAARSTSGHRPGTATCAGSSACRAAARASARRL